MRPVSRRHSRRGLVGGSTFRRTPISRSPIFPKFYYRRVPATVFYSTFTLYLLSERKQNRSLRRGFLHLHFGSFTNGYENLPTLTIIVNFHVVEKNIIGPCETTVNFVSYSYINTLKKQYYQYRKKVSTC